jgi:hypothetical protein
MRPEGFELIPATKSQEIQGGNGGSAGGTASLCDRLLTYQ